MDSDSDKEPPNRQSAEKPDEQRDRKRAAGRPGNEKHPEDPRSQRPACEIRREKHKEEAKKQRAAEVNHVTQGERQKWEEKRDRTTEDAKNRRAREEFRKEDWPQELREGTKRPGDESKRDSSTSAQPGGKAPGGPPRQKQADLHKPPLER